MYRGSIKKVLLCDAAFSVLPILKALKVKGYVVGVCGGRPQDPGHLLADESFIFNYADAEQLAAAFKNNHYDYIVPGCTDISYASSHHVARQFSLAGFDDSDGLKLFQNKSAFRENCKRNGFPTPAFTDDAKEACTLTFPILAKPAESFSGRGITKINSLPEMHALPAGNESAECLYEEFVEGNLYSHSAFIKDQKIILDFFVNEYCTVYPYQVNSSHLNISLDAGIRRKIKNNLEDFARINNLCDGLVHTQLIIKDDQFWLIEAARRCPGDLYSLLIQHATGMDYAALYAAGFCGEEIKSPTSAYDIKPISRHTVSVKEDCIFMSAQMDASFAKISYVPLKKTGEYLKAAPYDRAGIYFISHDSIAKMESLTEGLVNHVVVESAEPNERCTYSPYANSF